MPSFEYCYIFACNRFVTGLIDLTMFCSKIQIIQDYSPSSRVHQYGSLLARHKIYIHPNQLAFHRFCDLRKIYWHLFQKRMYSLWPLHQSVLLAFICSCFIRCFSLTSYSQLKIVGRYNHHLSQVAGFHFESENHQNDFHHEWALHCRDHNTRNFDLIIFFCPNPVHLLRVKDCFF